MTRAEQQDIIARKERVLTNYFNKDMNKLQSSITDRMQFTIENGSTDDVCCVAIATGNINTDGFVFNENPEVGEDQITMHHHNAAALVAAGYTADVVLDDAPDGVDFDEALVTMSTASGKSINHCKRYLSNNPRCVKRVTIAAVKSDGGKENPDAFNASMFLASLNPFQKEAAREVDMSQYFQTNQFQSGKIVIDYNYGDLQWNDMLYWAIEVAPATKMKVTVDFFPEEYAA